MKEGISLLLPAYREEENLGRLLPKAIQVLSGSGLPYEILVIETQEPLDRTGDVCRQHQVSCIRRENGDFYGDAIRTGIRHAQYDKTVFMDADGSHNPEDILRMLKIMQAEPVDLVIGSRYIAGGDSINGPILKWMSRILNWIFRMIFHLKIQDLSNSFRMYQTEQLKELNLQCVNFDIVEEILIRLSMRENFRCREIPICFSKRQAGESKRHLIPFIVSYLSTIVRLKRICREKPGK